MWSDEKRLRYRKYKQWETPIKTRIKRSEAMKEWWKNKPEENKRRSELVKRQWQNQQYRNKHLNGIKKWLEQRNPKSPAQPAQ